MKKLDMVINSALYGTSYALAWYDENYIIVAIEPYSEFADGTVHFHNRIAGDDLSELWQDKDFRIDLATEHDDDFREFKKLKL